MVSNLRLLRIWFFCSEKRWVGRRPVYTPKFRTLQLKILRFQAFYQQRHVRNEHLSNTLNGENAPSLVSPLPNSNFYNFTHWPELWIINRDVFRSFMIYILCDICGFYCLSKNSVVHAYIFCPKNPVRRWRPFSKTYQKLWSFQFFKKHTITKIKRYPKQIHNY